MNTKLQVSLELDAPLPSENLLIKDGDSGVTTSSINVVSSQQPVKKQTRQWAAWTRQEEESFFNALRQVGKNFEKITCRVQSKNKDQVRHYYYRLVRRMNKLLGPGFSLDAKNSKDTNAAMLRWWSLLEKYSCKASKLHLKPRRFKIFIEALEHQLLKDQKKNVRRRPVQGENCQPGSSMTVLLHSKAPGQDTRSVKVVVDSQNIQRVGSGKGSSMKRNTSTGINRINNKCDSPALRTARQRRKTGPASSAAYKRWEKAAIAGVSLVADAAEHLERTTDKKVSPDQRTLDESFPRLVVVPNGQKGIESVGRDLPPLPISACSHYQVRETCGQASVKLKLQLFPIDEGTRRALEKDEHNPHLELTVSARKKISSVLDHLNRKWGNSSIASGELILFPYNVQRENLGGYQRWTQDTIACAADVYASVGNPSVFRLRYGWFCNTELEAVTFQASSTSIHFQEDRSMNVSERKEQSLNAKPQPAPLSHHHSEQLSECPKDQPSPMMESTSHMPSYTDLSAGMTGFAITEPENNLQVSLINSSCFIKERGGGNMRRTWEDLDNNPRMGNGTSLSAGEWADSLTNVSIGELLSEGSRAIESTSIDQPTEGGSQYLQQIPFSCDSFDAAIAAHISGHQDRSGLLMGQVCHSSSIWDAEETCDGFSFQKVAALNHEAPSPRGNVSLGACQPSSNTNSMSSRGLVEELPNEEYSADSGCKGEPMEPMDNFEPGTHTPDDAAKDFGPDNSKDLNALTDIYWPDSLGPLDLDVPSSRYHAQDPMFADSISLSGLNRLIASSLDAFHNCSFFSLDKKELSSTGEARATSSFSDYKIGGEV
ncbi:TSL-kinase interacting protein 1-like [Telopea speciosissima]|uniref:TSL-kinase interacting protein 1-like n=1 Tax=Telopea speciosissima TaxID=54955 RepID=UPI001CC38D1F|nr:TSL-kinase interacting protein 1-like [Telopea speciosissima]XP_043705941.1 TSL-kinase interacting protein 1-like [Telopea speciosissima]